MIIDFHAHVFPDAIAEKAILSLAKRSGLTPCTNGTVSSTEKHMDLCDVDSFVCLNIATKPSQQRKINNFMLTLKSDKIIPFGAIHPFAEDVLEEIAYIKENGLHGIKLHPDYQDFFANDFHDNKRLYDIYSLISDLELPLIFHTGYDIGLGCPIKCTPLMIKDIAVTFPKLKIVAAHFGGWGMWKDALELLSDLDNVYFDTAFTYKLDKSTAEKLIRKKGAEKILFASDCPWESPKTTLDFIDSLSLTSNEKELIFYKNTKELLDLK